MVCCRKLHKSAQGYLNIGGSDCTDRFLHGFLIPEENGMEDLRKRPPEYKRNTLKRIGKIVSKLMVLLLDKDIEKDWGKVG